LASGPARLSSACFIGLNNLCKVHCPSLNAATDVALDAKPNVFSMAGGVLFLPFLPMLPVQILLNNLLYDVSETATPGGDQSA
jgi:hypothetical protein